MDRKEKAKETSIQSVLAQLGFSAEHEKDIRAHYTSPFRAEGVPSFIVYKNNNSWYDWGMGKGGDVIDFVMTYQQCSFSEAISFLLKEDANLKPYVAVEITKDNDTGIDIIDVKPFTNPYLIAYAKSRGISEPVLSTQCRQVDFAYRSWDHVTHTAIGFENDKHGWELRNNKHKVGNTPKTWRTIRGTKSNGDCDVFEGFFDFLGHLEYNKITHPDNDTFILNSLSFCSFVKDEVDLFECVNLYFDNDGAADLKIESYFQEEKYKDMRFMYKNHGDYNDFVKDALL